MQASTPVIERPITGQLLERPPSELRPVALRSVERSLAGPRAIELRFVEGSSVEHNLIELRPSQRGPIELRSADGGRVERSRSQGPVDLGLGVGRLTAGFCAVAAAEPREQLAVEVRALPAARCLYASGEYRVLVAHGSEVPAVLREIGRLREMSFRAVGEGTGKARDLDAFDDIYQQLFVWHEATQQVLGAYRLCRTDLVLRALGPEALYTRTLFDYDVSFLDALGPALELGRSFVRPEHQRAGRVLALLWRGIGQLLAAGPRYRTLFGPVSISAAYSQEARCLMASRLSSGPYRHPLSSKVRARRPLSAVAASEGLDESPSALSRRISQLEPDRKGLPVLVREYLKLGGRFLSFSVDPDFQQALDGLVAVELDRTPPKLLALYLGPESYEHFRRFPRVSSAAACLPQGL